MVIYLLRWWYGRGFTWVIDSIENSLSGVGKTLAIKVLLKTWFDPWKQITTTSGYANFMQKFVDNLVSRFVGFFVRTFMLITGFFWALAIMVFGAIWLVSWAFIPLLIILLPILTVLGVKI